MQHYHACMCVSIYNDDIDIMALSQYHSFEKFGPPN